MTPTMKTKFKILPYNPGSKSAKALADALGGKRLKQQTSFVPSINDVVINWGKSQFPAGENYVTMALFCLNTPSAVASSSNKKTFFQTIRDSEKLYDPDQASDLPEFWLSKADVPSDAFDDDGVVVCRTVLNGHSGAGIVLASSPDELVDAPLYVRYVLKKEEYRIHLGRTKEGQDYQTKVIAAQRKAKKNDAPVVNWKIRNLANGFVYTRQNVNVPPSVMKAAIRVFERSRLDFGAVDVIWNEKSDKAYVLEINTSPGLEGQTVSDYAKFFVDNFQK